MKHVKISALALIMAASSANAVEQPDASELVGKTYGGVHGVILKADQDRLSAPGGVGFPYGEAFAYSEGFGVELGHRLSETNELRLSITDLDLDFKSTSRERDGKAISLDFLYFPYAESLYMLGGLNRLDIIDPEFSLNAGVGYRHHFTERLAAYAEVKAHFEIDESHNDQSAQVGLIYFFGGSEKSAPAPVKKAPAKKKKKVVKKKAPKPVVKPLDSDNDGVIDSKDKCKSTPKNDKVSANGCTIFTEKTASQRLLINFANNKADIDSAYLGEVRKIANFLKRYPHADMTIEGHSSAQGSAAYNKTLSQKRADAVVSKLVNDFNIDASRLTAIGYGEERLLNKANTAAAHKENRRIEANVTATKKVRQKVNQ